MNCPCRNEDELDLLLDYAAGRLDAARTTLLSRHALSCGECSEFLRDQSLVWRALDEVSAPDLSVDFNRGVWQRIDAAAASETWLARLGHALRDGIWKPAVPLAAVAVLITVGFVYDHRATAVTVSLAEADQMQHVLEDLQLLQNLNALAAEVAEPIL